MCIMKFYVCVSFSCLGLWACKYVYISLSLSVIHASFWVVYVYTFFYALSRLAPPAAPTNLIRRHHHFLFSSLPIILRSALEYAPDWAGCPSTPAAGPAASSSKTAAAAAAAAAAGKGKGEEKRGAKQPPKPKPFQKPLQPPSTAAKRREEEEEEEEQGGGGAAGGGERRREQRDGTVDDNAVVAQVGGSINQSINQVHRIHRIHRPASHHPSSTSPPPCLEWRVQTKPRLLTTPHASIPTHTYTGPRLLPRPRPATAPETRALP